MDRNVPRRQRNLKLLHWGAFDRQSTGVAGRLVSGFSWTAAECDRTQCCKWSKYLRTPRFCAVIGGTSWSG